MPRQLAKDLLIKIESAPASGTFVTLGMLQTADYTITRNEIPATNKDSPNDWEEVDAGLRSMSANGTMFFDSGASVQVFRDTILGGGKANAQIVDPGEGTFEGAFLFTSYGKSGSQEGNVEANVSLRNDGEPTFTPA